MTAHSKIGASSMERWSACPGSVALSEGIAGKSSIYAEEGTAAHALGEHCLRINSYAAKFIDVGFSFDDHGERKTITVTDEMAAAVQTYVDHCRSIQGTMHVEHKFDLSEVYHGLFGTSDSVIFDEKSATLHVIDYKHGAGKPVDVIGNPQLRYYAVGALITLGYKAAQVVITVVQPRCEHKDGHIRSETMAVIDLLDWTADLVAYAKKVSEAEQSKLTGDEWTSAYLADGDHCRWCRAAATCPKLSRTALAVASDEFHIGRAYDPQKLANALEKLPLLKAWIKNLEEFALDEATSGKIPPGFKLVDKRATRKWLNEKEAEEALNMLEIDGIYNAPTLRTVAQIEKLIPKENRTMLETLVVKESSGKTLAPISDSRPAAQSKALDDFS